MTSFDPSGVAALVLLLTMVVGLARVIIGPTLADRMVVAQLFGTTGVAILLLLSTRSENGALRDVALVFALLALITVVAFVRWATERKVRGSE